MGRARPALLSHSAPRLHEAMGWKRLARSENASWSAQMHSSARASKIHHRLAVIGAELAGGSVLR